MEEKDPPVQGIVNAVMAPIRRQRPEAGESGASAVGVALDADGNPIDQTDLLKLLEAEGKPQ